MMTTLWRMAALWNTIAGMWRDRRDLPLLITNRFAARCDCCISARRKDLRRWYA